MSATTRFFSDTKRKTSRKRLYCNQLGNLLCACLAGMTLIPLFSLISLLLKKGLPLLSFEALTSLPAAPGIEGGGFGNAIVGTFTMVLIATLLAAPIAILAAVFTQEYASDHFLSYAIRFVAKLLVGIPSIICGAFAFGLIVLSMGTFSAIAGGIALALVMLPTVFIASEEALRQVPEGYRQAAYGLGATPFQTIWRIVLPEACPSILTGVMLAVGRAAGETAPILFTALFSQGWASSLMQPIASIPVLIYNFSGLPYPYQIKMAWTAALVLVILITSINVLAQTFFQRKRAKA